MKNLLAKHQQAYNNFEIKSMRSKRNLSASARSIKLGLSSRRLATSRSPSSNSPAPDNRLTISQKSIRPINFRRKPAKEVAPDVFVHISNESLFLELKAYSIEGLVRFNGGEGQQKKELLVISKIEEFYQQYNSFCSTHSASTTVTWIILSNAVNGLQIQEEFNRNYEPLTFYFLKDVQEIANFINFKQQALQRVTKSLSFFSKIINFGVHNNDYACILQFNFKIQFFQPSENNQLWLISKQHLSKLNVKEYRKYFLGEHSIKFGQIQLVQAQSQKILYLLLVQDFSLYLSSVGIKAYQQSIDENFLKNSLFKIQEDRYYQKVIPSYLPNQIIINLVGFSNELAKIVQKTCGFVTRFSDLSLPSHCHVYSLYLGMKRECDKFGVSLKDDASIKQQMLRIQSYFQMIAKLQDQYAEISCYFDSFLLAIFNIDNNPQFLEELAYFTKKPIYELNDLNELRNLGSKSIILIGKIGQHQTQLFPQSVTVVNKDSNNQATHDALIRAIVKINTIEYRQDHSCSISITNFSSQFQQLQSHNNSVYRHRQIADFSSFLNEIVQDSGHLVILEMEEYTQQRERLLEQKQLIKDIKFEVYLLYGNEFIFRSKNAKYTFLKKDQLLTKIKNIIEKQAPTLQENELEFEYNSDCNFHSDIQHNRSITLADTISTPNLYYFSNNKPNIIICVPKSIPFHTLHDRSQQKYSLLIYSHVKQVAEMVKHLPSDHFAAIITTEKAKQVSSSKGYEYIGVNDLTEKSVRDEVDRIIQRFELGKRQGSISKKPKMHPVIVLYNSSIDKQVKIISRMNQIFKNSKVLIISKKQFKAIKRVYSISDKIQIYEIGKPEIAFAKRLKTPLQIFKIYMSPQIASHEFSAEKLQFSAKLLLLRTIIEKNKKDKMKSVKELTLSRSISPKGKSILQKQCFLSEPGLVMAQGRTTNKLLKKEKFTNRDQLLNLCLLHHFRGNQLLIVVGEQEFFELKDEFSIYGTQITWIVLVSDHKCIIREANIIFCKDDQFEHSLALIVEAYRIFKGKSFQLLQSQPSNQPVTNRQLSGQILVQIKPIENQSKLFKHQQNQFHINIYINEKVREFSIANLSSALIFNNKDSMHSKMNIFLPMNPESALEADQSLQIVCDQHNTRFLEQSLKLIEETRYILITYENIGELSTYSTISKALFVFQKETCKIQHPNSIVVSSSETPQMFSKRLKLFLTSLRRVG